MFLPCLQIGREQQAGNGKQEMRGTGPGAVGPSTRHLLQLLLYSLQEGAKGDMLTTQRDLWGQPHPSMTTPPVREHWEHWTAEDSKTH
jgi:hypothetical protein